MKFKKYLSYYLSLIIILGLTSCSSDTTNNGTVIGSTNQGNITFSITQQTPNGAFAIDSNTGELTVVDGSLFDFENTP